MLIAALALAAQPCPATPLVPPATMAAWSATPASMIAAADPDDRRIMPLPIGRRVTVKLLSVDSVDFAVAPQGKAPGREGGLLLLEAPAPGRYRVLLSAAAWIDVIGPGGPVASIGHGHGPECAGIRKAVEFALEAGRYTVQLSGAQAGTIGVMVAAAEGGESQ